MIQVIDIRKHDPEKVIEYWKSKGGKDDPYEWDWDQVKSKFPFLGISRLGYIRCWPEIDDEFELIDLPTEPQLIPGKEYTMRNGEKAIFVAKDPNGVNFFYHLDDKTTYQYEGLKFNSGLTHPPCDIIINVEKKEPRIIWVNEYEKNKKRYLSISHHENVKSADKELCGNKYIRTIKFREVIE